MTLSVTAFSIMTLSIMTLSIIIKKHNTHQNDIQYNETRNSYAECRHDEYFGAPVSAYSMEAL
jgi:hypothetical protein